MSETVSSAEAQPGASTDGPGALFVRDGALLVPTEAARGPWRRDALHGGAVAALLASAVDLPGRTPVRLTVDLLGPVPCAPLSLVVTPAEGGDRVARQTVALLAGDTEVATASCLGVRETAAVPPPGADHPAPFAAAEVPDLFRTRPAVVDLVGWECFDSAGICVRTLRTPTAAHETGIYVNLVVPVIADEATTPLSRAAAAADYASHHLANTLHFDEWSFMNADLTVHLSRLPTSHWVGLVSTGLTPGHGAGLSVGDLHDAQGRLGQAVQSLVVEPRRRARS